uniref:30s ribosomal protein s7 n=2 Tax=Prototheca TaxID=3110 RepID=A0A2Z6BEN3_9CHLO|nr:30s ribosomal protein s7 [Prototheca stagnorum]BBD20185.1 30s ribosomal protein s7 [Prototheca stagnorum]
MNLKFQSNKLFYLENIEKSSELKIELIEPFINQLMIHGKKNGAYKIFFSVLEHINNIMKKEDPFSIYELAIHNATPNVLPKIKTPYSFILREPHMSKNRQAIRWILEEARKPLQKKEKPLYQKIAEELLKAYLKKGQAVSKKIEADLIASKKDQLDQLI